MHLVFVSSLVPVAAPKSGYDIANRAIVDGLRLAGHKVSVLGFLQPGAEPADPETTRLLGTLQVTNARVGRLRKLLWLKDAVFNGEPVSVAKMHAASVSDIRAALSGFSPFDALVLNSVQLPAAFLEIFEGYPFVFVAHNVESRSARENAEMAQSAVERFLFRREARLLLRVERDLCRKAHHVFALADADREELGVAFGERSSTLPLVTSVTPPPGLSPRRFRYDVGLIGSWTWAANRAGLDWFLTEVVPLLPADFTIAIAGDLGTDARDVPGNVDIVGRVVDARDFVRTCRVVPLASRVGTGVQLKTIETFELGLPAVATTNALRGISAIPANCVTADRADAFAQAVVRLVEQSRAGEHLDCDGRSFHAMQLHGLVSALAKGLGHLARTG